MPYTMRQKYTKANGVNYGVCGLCGGLNEVGTLYSPVYMVFDDKCEPGNREENYNHALNLCYGCYFDQWMEVQADTPFPSSVRDGRVELSLTAPAPPEIVEQLRKLEALAEDQSGATTSERIVAKNKIKELSQKYSIATQDYAKLEPGKGFVDDAQDEYTRWERALQTARASNGAETVEQAYNRLYRTKPAEVTIEAAV